MPSNPFISICIPAYKRRIFLERLLESIAIQTFRDFEVIVTDDSPDDEVSALCKEYAGRMPLMHFRNGKTLGTPENWNEAVRKASASWIKIMHDDDWFTSPDSLTVFAQAVADHPGADFIFAAYRDVYMDEGRSSDVFVRRSLYRRFLGRHAILIARNLVGPPSVVMYRKDPGVFFDPNTKWLVDIDFYIRYLRQHKPEYIRRVLVNVGLGDQQVTRDCFRRRPVEIPENFYLLNKLGTRVLRQIRIYDAWWRLIRNLEITSSHVIRESGYHGPIPDVIGSMIGWQKRIPGSLLRLGAFSKTLMSLHYICHFNRIQE